MSDPVPTAGASLACPECGTLTEVTLSRRDATDFCPACDYPMFWARPSDVTGSASVTGDDARRRSPGASGESALATVPCPHCAELNLPGAWLCVRCDGSMIPEPPPPPPPVLMPQPAPEPLVVKDPVPAEPFPVLWLAAMIAIGAGAWGLSLLL